MGKKDNAAKKQVETKKGSHSTYDPASRIRNRDRRVISTLNAQSRKAERLRRRKMHVAKADRQLADYALRERIITAEQGREYLAAFHS